MKSKFQIPIKQPEWLKHSKPGRTLDMYLQGKLPKSIDGWMLVVSLKHPLRAVYGSDLKAAWALMKWAIANKISAVYQRIMYGLGIWKEDADDLEDLSAATQGDKQP